jgi:hypothetical protein
MPVTDAEHQDAISALIADPTNSSHAQRVFELAQLDPQGAHHWRERIKSALPALPLELVSKAYRRHNLAMPYMPDKIPQPGSLDDLIDTMKQAVSAWEPMKAIGDGYGFANTGFTRGYLFPMVQRLNKVLTIDETVLKAGTDVQNLCRFEAGATIETVTNALWGREKTLLNQPGYEKLTYVGVMSSGGHGSGTWCGPLSDHVRALHLVTVDDQGQVVQLQVEPTNGMSDRAKFEAKYPDVILKQDDQMFQSCAVAMGCLGIIYSVTIEVQDAFNIRERRTKLSWSAMKQKLPALLAEQGPGKRLHSIEMWLNPYAVDGDTWVVLGEREWSSDPPEGSRPFVVEYGGPEFLYELVAWWCHHHPKAVPGLINAAISATVSGDVVMHAPKGLNFGAVNLAPVTAASCGVPAAGIEALVDSLIAWFENQAATKEAYITSPVGLRFVRAGKAYLSPSFDRDTCMIEAPILLGVPHARDTLDGFHDFLYETCRGRPHWGQVNDVPSARVHELYPQLEVFLETFRNLNPKGFFDNAFTEQVSFRRR